MTDSPDIRITAPEAAALLGAVHRVRDRLGVPQSEIRDLTKALADAAGLPPEAQPWPGLASLPDSAIVTTIREAMASALVVHVEHRRQDGSLWNMIIEPYHVRLEGGHWFLIARLADTGEETVLRMDKLTSAAPGKPFTPRKLDLDRYLDGVFVPPEPGMRATVRFGPRNAAYAGQRWGPGKPGPGGTIEVHIPYQREHWLVRTLMEFGDDVVVLGPESLRLAVRERSAATLSAYGDTDE